MWPDTADSLVALQERLAVTTPSRWQPGGSRLAIGGCWVCFPRGNTGRGGAGDPAWVAAVVMDGYRVVERWAGRGETAAAYQPGLLALRVGQLMEDAVRALDAPPDVLLVDATAADHPRRAGLALHLGEVLGIPTIGLTHRPLLADGDWPADERGATSPVRIGGTVVGCWMRTRPGTRPLVVHPGWRVDLDTAVEIVRRTTPRRRTPEPLRRARQLARRTRATN
ncbi:MAG TPA: endonuclease V [Nocardioidaceae bacterium]